MQGRVETLHKMMPTPVSKWINGREAASVEGLASLDPGSMVSPPKGLEYGHVPIVFYQGHDKPAECHDGPAPPPSPPPPTPSPTPPSPPSPSECGTCKVCFNPTSHKCQ